jgi:uncharacterized protein YceH (UPF0502 family)
MSMGRLDSDLEDLYRRRQGAFQVMLASVTGDVESEYAADEELAGEVAPSGMTRVKTDNI